METIKLYVELIKTWSKQHPVKFVFILGFIAGFIIRGII
jgi:hypothetical protein